jgi:hypothetical protein
MKWPDSLVRRPEILSGPIACNGGDDYAEKTVYPIGAIGLAQILGDRDQGVSDGRNGRIIGAETYCQTADWETGWPRRLSACSTRFNVCSSSLQPMAPADSSIWYARLAPHSAAVIPN